MSGNIFVSMIFNISFLVLIASLMCRTRIMKELIYNREKSLGNRLALAIFFGTISVLSTYTGVGVNGAIVNTRVIGVLSAGLMGGPVVGLGAALIGGLHRWLFDIGGFTAVACACSTLLEGVLGVFCHKAFREGRLRSWRLVLLAAAAEVGQMGVILLIARPFGAAVELVRVIALPMILMNSCGIVAFIGAFQYIFLEQSSLTDRRIRLSLSIAEQCLPHLRKGLHTPAELDAAVDIIRAQAGCAGFWISDRERILSQRGVEAPSGGLPREVRQAMDTMGTVIADRPEEGGLEEILKKHVLIAAPLSQKGRPIGCLVLVEEKKWISLEAQVGFLEGLAVLFSTQLELSQVEEQKRLLQKAEFQMLQTQVNPHFLFNCLNTISCFCREKPERAKELLLLLANYYRYAIEGSDYMVPLSRELEQVRTYLQLEQARFEEKLTLHFDIPGQGWEEAVPSLILQPIVENAIKHGADSQGRREVTVKVRRELHGVRVEVTDCGQGFPISIVEGLEQGGPPSGKVGLKNVHRRLKSIYGEDNGLRIRSTLQGSRVEMFFPVAAGKEELECVS